MKFFTQWRYSAISHRRYNLFLRIRNLFWRFVNQVDYRLLNLFIRIRCVREKRDKKSNLLHVSKVFVYNNAKDAETSAGGLVNFLLLYEIIGLDYTKNTKNKTENVLDISKFSLDFELQTLQDRVCPLSVCWLVTTIIAIFLCMFPILQRFLEVILEGLFRHSMALL